MFLPNGPLSTCGRAGRTFAALFFLLFAPAVVLAQTNLDFESGTVGGTPTGWFYGGNPSGFYQGSLIANGCLHGSRCLHLTGSASAPAGTFGVLSQSIVATRYRGQTVRYRVALKVSGSTGARARLWIRSDRTDGTSSGIINSPDITVGDWRYVTASLAIPNDTGSLIFGVLNYPGSTVLVDDGSFEGSEVAPTEAPRPMTTAGVQNLAAFAQVLGYVRHFHPSDQVEQTDWTHSRHTA